MTVLTDPTLGTLIEAAQVCSASDLQTMLLRADLERFVIGDPHSYANKQDLIRRRLLGAREAHLEGEPDAQRALQRFVVLLLDRKVSDPDFPPGWFVELREHLLADGLEVAWKHREADGRWDLPPISYRLLPTDTAVAPLASEISALEAELQRRGYNSVLVHYRQATDGLLNRKFESCNGDLRTTLEDLVTRIAEDHTCYQRALDSKTGLPRANQGGTAINHLLTVAGGVARADGGEMLHGLWTMTCTNGPHPGTSHADEARSRMQLVTATARLLLSWFPA